MFSARRPPPATWSFACGVEVPMPILPVVSTVNNVVPLEDATENGLALPGSPVTVRVELKLVVDPIARSEIVVVASVVVPCTVKRLVVVLLVISEEVANMFWTYKLRNRRVEEPSEYVASTEGVVLRAICSVSVGVVVPIPTLPFANILSFSVKPPPV